MQNASTQVLDKCPTGQFLPTIANCSQQVNENQPMAITKQGTQVPRESIDKPNSYPTNGTTEIPSKVALRHSPKYSNISRQWTQYRN